MQAACEHCHCCQLMHSSSMTAAEKTEPQTEDEGSSAVTWGSQCRRWQWGLPTGGFSQCCLTEWDNQRHEPKSTPNLLSKKTCGSNRGGRVTTRVYVVLALMVEGGLGGRKTKGRLQNYMNKVAQTVHRLATNDIWGPVKVRKPHCTTTGESERYRQTATETDRLGERLWDKERGLSRQGRHTWSMCLATNHNWTTFVLEH